MRNIGRRRLLGDPPNNKGIPDRSAIRAWYRWHGAIPQVGAASSGTLRVSLLGRSPAPDTGGMEPSVPQAGAGLSGIPRVSLTGRSPVSVTCGVKPSVTQTGAAMSGIPTKQAFPNDRPFNPQQVA